MNRKQQRKADLSRREAVQSVGLAAACMVVGSSCKKEGAKSDIPRRVLGRTREWVTALSLGTTGVGFSEKYSPEEIAKITEAAYASGVRYFDTARRYGNAELGLGLALPKYRNDIFLTSKVFADTIPDAEQSLAESFQRLKTDHIDLVYFHNLGKRDMARALEPDGVFTWLVKQKKAGRFKYLGLSGHNLPERFPRFIETGEVDVIMVPINFADRYTYNFEEKVLPIARKHNVGIVAMKVMGGIAPGDTLENLVAGPYPPAIGSKYADLAIRYALGVEGVAVANIGTYNTDEVKANVVSVKNYKPLTAEERTLLKTLGKKMAEKWGEHFGPVQEQSA